MESAVALSFLGVEFSRISTHLLPLVTVAPRAEIIATSALAGLSLGTAVGSKVTCKKKFCGASHGASHWLMVVGSLAMFAPMIFKPSLSNSMAWCGEGMIWYSYLLGWDKSNSKKMAMCTAYTAPLAFSHLAKLSPLPWIQTAGHIAGCAPLPLLCVAGSFLQD